MAVLYTMYVPVRYNNGQRIPRNILDHVVHRAVELSGGCTVSSVQHGAWRADNGTVQRETVRTVSSVDTAQHAVAWRALAKDTAILCDQECVLLTTTHLDTVQYIGQSARVEE
jgi:hypothetical protein